MEDFKNASTFRFREGKGEMLVHCLLPRERTITRRGGPGQDFYTPGDDRGGPWGSGENWPLDPEHGGPLPQDPRLVHMWKTFWGNDFSRILPSNRKNVVPGAWRIEVAPALPAKEDLFLHVLEIGDTDSTGKKHVALVDGSKFAGAISESGPCVLFRAAESPESEGEVSLPDLGFSSLTIAGLMRNGFYELTFNGPNVTSSAAAALPGVTTSILRLRANENGILRVDQASPGNSRLRITRV